MASFERQRMMATLGVEVSKLEPGEIDLAFHHDDRFTQQNGYMHAGAIGSVLDSACGYAAFTLMPANADVLTVEFKLNLLRPAVGDRFLVSGRVVKQGRTLTVCTAEASAADSDRPLAIMTGTVMALA
jgi:uncharacterized protein (TIGR00369 family)